MLFRQPKFQVPGQPRKSDGKTFRLCVLDRDKECLIGGNRTEMLISYFCGYGYWQSCFILTHIIFLFSNPSLNCKI